MMRGTRGAQTASRAEGAVGRQVVLRDRRRTRVAADRKEMGRKIGGRPGQMVDAQRGLDEIWKS